MNSPITQIQLWKKQIRSFSFPRWNDLPEVDLYMDQIISYLSQKLSVFYEIPENETEENRYITATMINNYVKQKVISAPVRKRYNKTQLVSLLMLFCVKQVLSIGETADFIAICMQDKTSEETYNRFCTVFENVLHHVAEGKTAAIQENRADSDPILSAAAIAFANKLYTEKLILLKKGTAAGTP